jgi:uncharacterized membrane protein
VSGETAGLVGMGPQDIGARSVFPAEDGAGGSPPSRSVASGPGKGVVSTDTATTVHARIGRAVPVWYGVSVAGMAALILLSGDLGALFQPVPGWMPSGRGLAYASGAVLLAGGLALLARKTTRLAALALTVDFLFVWLLLLNLPTTVATPTLVGNWESCGLNMTIAAGAWILLARSSPPAAGPAARLFGERGVSLARRLYALGVPLVGLAHLADAASGTEYVPAWLPLRIGWVYLTGAGHIAAGLAIFFGVLPGLAAVLEAGQITAFVILAHLPAVFGAPRDRVQWGMLLYASAIAASAWLVVAGPPSWLPRRAANEPRRSPSWRTTG